MKTRLFFYGTLMAGFDRRQRTGIDDRLTFIGRGWATGKLYDLGLFPAAVPSDDGRILGEIYETGEPEPVLAVLDEMEGYHIGEPDRSLYQRELVPVTLEDGTTVDAWVYFYNAPIGQAAQIESGDYSEHFKTSE